MVPITHNKYVHTKKIAIIFKNHIIQTKQAMLRQNRAQCIFVIHSNMQDTHLIMDP